MVNPVDTHCSTPIKLFAFGFESWLYGLGPLEHSTLIIIKNMIAHVPSQKADPLPSPSTSPQSPIRLCMLSVGIDILGFCDSII